MVGLNSIPAGNPRGTTPFVSVVIPAYDAAVYIGDALKSVFDQTYTDYEVIVINDGSPDRESLERAIGPFRDRIRYEALEHRGCSAARNAGIRLARGTLYAQLDADDQWEPDYLAYHVAFLAEHPEVDVVYPNATFFGHPDDEGMDFMTLCPSEGEATFGALLEQRCVVMASVTARLSAIREAGSFDESLMLCEDFDLWLRLTHTGRRIAYHRRQLVRYRRTSTSLSANRERTCENQLRVLTKVRQTMALTPGQEQAVEAGVRRCTAELNVLKAQRALRQHDVEEARRYLREASRSRSSAELLVARLLLRYSPGLFAVLLRVRRGLRRRLSRPQAPPA